MFVQMHNFPNLQIMAASQLSSSKTICLEIRPSEKSLAFEFIPFSRRIGEELDALLSWL